MAVQTITFNPTPQSLQYVGQAQVYWKRLWADQWVPASFLEVDELNWTAAPSLPTASLTWHYGRIARPGVFGTFERVSRIADKQRYYLKIVAPLEYVDNSWITKDWYGILDIVEDQIGGTMYMPDGLGGQLLVPRGEQILTAYGLEWLLQNHFVTSSWWMVGNGIAEQMERGLTFNERGLANRHAYQQFGNWYFANDRADARFWSTQQIVEYLLKWHTPRAEVFSETGKPEFTIELSDLRNLPDWDQPELPADGIRTYDLLNQIIPRQRLLGWYLDVDTRPAEQEDPAPAKIRLRTFTYTSEQLSIGGSGGSSSSSVPANENQKHLIFDGDPTATVALKDSNVNSFDQIVFRGARRRSCCTVCFDESLKQGWTSAQETAYEAGASTAPDFPDADEVKERQARNQEVRSSDRLHAVFRRFVIPSTWNGRATGQMEADDPLYVAGGHAVFPEHDPLSADPAADIAIHAEEPRPIYHLGLTLNPTLPLLAGVDYTGDKIATKTFAEASAYSNREELPALVCWLLPGTDPIRYANIEELGRKAALEQSESDEKHTWSASVHVVENAAAIELNVQGGLQHELARTQFDPRPEDDLTGDQSAHDWYYMLVTVCLLDDRFCQGVYPAEPPEARNGDALRVLVHDVGDAYRQDYVAVGTVVSIDATTGELERSTGGYVRNDTFLLTDAAKVAYQWYSQTRRVLSAASRCPVDLDLGAMIVKVNDPADAANALDVNSPITNIRLLIGRGAPQSPPPAPQIVYTTAAGELDPLRTIGRRSLLENWNAGNLMRTLVPSFLRS